MKKLIMIALVFLTGCVQTEEIKDNKSVYSGFLYNVNKVRVDSIDYLVVYSGGSGVAIIKHGEVKN